MGIPWSALWHGYEDVNTVSLSIHIMACLYLPVEVPKVDVVDTEPLERLFEAVLGELERAINLTSGSEVAELGREEDIGAFACAFCLRGAWQEGDIQ